MNRHPLRVPGMAPVPPGRFREQTGADGSRRARAGAGGSRREQEGRVLRMKVLILGGTRFLGRHLAQQALDADARETALRDAWRAR